MHIKHSRIRGYFLAVKKYNLLKNTHIDEFESLSGLHLHSDFDMQK